MLLIEWEVLYKGCHFSLFYTISISILLFCFTRFLSQSYFFVLHDFYLNLTFLFYTISVSILLFCFTRFLSQSYFSVLHDFYLNLTFLFYKISISILLFYVLHNFYLNLTFLFYKISISILLFCFPSKIHHHFFIFVCKVPFKKKNLIKLLFSFTFWNVALVTEVSIYKYDSNTIVNHSSEYNLTFRTLASLHEYLYYYLSFLSVKHIGDASYEHSTRINYLCLWSSICHFVYCLLHWSCSNNIQTYKMIAFRLI